MFRIKLGAARLREIAPPGQLNRWAAATRGTFSILQLVRTAPEQYLHGAKDNFAELRNRFLRFAPQCWQWPETVIYFKHIPTSYNEHGIAMAWSEDIEIHGMGINDKDARKAWLKGLCVVHEFLSKESLLWAGELKKRRRTS